MAAKNISVIIVSIILVFAECVNEKKVTTNFCVYGGTCMLSLSNKTKRYIISMCMILYLLGCWQPYIITASAKETSSVVQGNVYVFSGDAHYEFSAATDSSGTIESNTFGTFMILGDVRDTGTEIGMPDYFVDSETVRFCYSYDQSRLNVAETEWHVVDDKSKKINTLSLDKNILSGAILVQSSKNGVDWITDVTMTDIFTEDSSLVDPFYEASRIQLENGCYYRLIVAYKLQRKIGEEKTVFGLKDQKEEKKITEVYEFYAMSSEAAKSTASATAEPLIKIGEKEKTGKDNGYLGKVDIDKNDPHYGWDLGTFIINGYTRKTVSEGTTIFLKNVGDKVTLWFSLNQDIYKLNGKDTLSISEDSNGYDQYFEIPQTDFKHGALIIRYTDFEGNTHEPVIYTDFLAANAITGADTRVQLFEEGDYEVSLDYEIKNEIFQVWPFPAAKEYTNYKIFFEFSIRNGNCMVYPFDIESGNELSDNDITARGFRLDMAKSRYLTIDVTRSALYIGENGLLLEDVRYNGPAKDNDLYIEEGIYTFTVKNLYTGESTVKTIYVGTDKYLLALSKNGCTVTDLNEKIKQLATISEDGTIMEYVPATGEEPEEETESSASGESKETEEMKVRPVISENTQLETSTGDISDQDDAETVKKQEYVLIAIVGLTVVIVVGGIVAWAVNITAKQKRKGKGE